VKNVWENIKTNAQNQNDSLGFSGGSLEYKPPLIDLNPVVDNLVQGVKNVWENIKTNAQNQNNYEEYPTLEQPNYERIAIQSNTILDVPESWQSKEDENSRIHEELAEKTKKISKLEAEDKKKEERISKLEARVEELEKNRILTWFPRALDDSKDEKIF